MRGGRPTSERKINSQWVVGEKCKDGVRAKKVGSARAQEDGVADAIAPALQACTLKRKRLQETADAASWAMSIG